MKTGAILIVFGLLLNGISYAGEIYKYVDENGTVCFTDDLVKAQRHKGELYRHTNDSKQWPKHDPYADRLLRALGKRYQAGTPESKHGDRRVGELNESPQGLVHPPQGLVHPPQYLFDPRTGEYYLRSGEAYVRPKTGEFYFRSGDHGVIDPKTGKVIPVIPTN